MGKLVREDFEKASAVESDHVREDCGKRKLLKATMFKSAKSESVTAGLRDNCQKCRSAKSMNDKELSRNAVSQNV